MEVGTSVAKMIRVTMHEARDTAARGRQSAVGQQDPFDRVVALGDAHDLTVLTSHENIRKYAGVGTLW